MRTSNHVAGILNWALRNIGKRNLSLNAEAVVCAEKIRDTANEKASGERGGDTRVCAARWVAADALCDHVPAVIVISVSPSTMVRARGEAQVPAKSGRKSESPGGVIDGASSKPNQPPSVTDRAIRSKSVRQM